MSPLIRAISLLVLVQLTACNSSSEDEVPPVPTEIALQPDCSGQHCSAVGSAYSGSGIGVWAADNHLNQPAVVNVDLSGLPPAARVTLVITNQGSSARPLSSTTVSGPAGSSDAMASGGKLRSLELRQSERLPPARPALLSIGAAAAAAGNALPVNRYQLGDHKEWTSLDGLDAPPYVTTLRSQAPLSNGRVVNIWVTDSEWGATRVTQALADIYAQRFATPVTGVFDMVTSLYGGQPWGPFPDTAGTLINPDEDIQIVMAEIPDIGGFFSARHMWSRAVAPDSNEALAFFMTASDAYNPKYGIGYSAPVLGHEFVHMLNYYNRTVLNGSTYSDWLEEISAMSLQEMAGSQFNPGDSLGWWTAQWLENGLYNCSLNVLRLEKDCNSYSVGGAFASWLMRQYGLAFFHDLTATHEADGIAALDSAIKKQDPQSGFNTALRRWGASAALLDAGQLPAGYGYPLRVESVNGVTYTLKALSGPDYSGRQSMPATLPAVLQPYAHAPLRYAPTEGRFRRSIILAPETALTVVVN